MLYIQTNTHLFLLEGRSQKRSEKSKVTKQAFDFGGEKYDDDSGQTVVTLLGFPQPLIWTCHANRRNAVEDYAATSG